MPPLPAAPPSAFPVDKSPELLVSPPSAFPPEPPSPPSDEIALIRSFDQ